MRNLTIGDLKLALRDLLDERADELAAAAAAQQAFVPKLDVLRAPYADEASAALDNRPELARLKAELKAVATPSTSQCPDMPTASRQAD
ncbi:hypothetical protein [Sorangium sp. So ce131]|uniref:hypothetical protein n=1 Tax=Sorangium sp. So ce131 TaxID=3133282 RepID=UPI003F6324D5